MRESALKHGLSEAEIREAFFNPAVASVIRERDIGTEPQRFAMIGSFTTPSGVVREAEIVYVLLWNGDIIIFHANYLTKGFVQEIEKARRRKA